MNKNVVWYSLLEFGLQFNVLGLRLLGVVDDAGVADGVVVEALLEQPVGDDSLQIKIKRERIRSVDKLKVFLFHLRYLTV